MVVEVLRVTVVAADGHLVYGSLVRPENYIIDYNTRFSRKLHVISMSMPHNRYGMSRTI
jgi:hypothetical protein